MSATVQIPPPRTSLATLPLDQRRGIHAMWCTIATEAMLFIAMFGAYYYLGSNKDRWADETAPLWYFALILLAILLSSSVVLAWGEHQVKKGRFVAGRIALWITVVMGLCFLGLQSYEYLVEWKSITPYSDSYGSIFFTITSLHAAHVIVGLALLMYIGIFPRYGDTRRTPHKPYKTVAYYWHFVDGMWVIIVTFLYLIPTLQRYLHVHH